MSTNNNTEIRRTSILDSMRLEPWEYPRDLTIDFSTLSKGDLIELGNCVILLRRWKSGVDKKLDYNEQRETFDHMVNILAKGRDLTIKKHLYKRGSR